MKNILDIMKLTGVDETMARKIFDEMCASGMDFSECTKSEFKREVLAAARRIG